MANQGCNNGTSDEASYSSPVPVIGYYIAGVSVVCLVLMLCDTVAARRSGKFWVPCKFFALNSVILSLLSIATKLPVDLTTPMPGPQDQLSKLCGTTFICVSIAFLLPSLATNTKSERLSNVASLTIFIATVVVNICIQLFTGVIWSSFMVEHIIVLCCMLLSVPIMWQAAFETELHKDLYVATHKRSLDSPDHRSMLERLMQTYISQYTLNPQLYLCRDPSYTAMAGVCIICSSALIQALVRHLSLESLKSYAEKSSYGWSIWLVVVIQTLVVMVGSFVTCFRVYTQSTEISERTNTINISEISERLHGSNPIRGFHTKDSIWVLLVFIEGVVFVDFRLIRPPLRLIFSLLRKIVRSFKHGCEEDGTEAVVLVDGQPKKFQRKHSPYSIERYQTTSSWVVESMVERCMNNMKTWMESGMGKSLKDLKQLLSRTMPSEQTHTMTVRGERCASFIDLVLLVRIAKVSIPSTLSASLEDAFRDAYDYIDFIDTKSNSGDRDKEDASKVAKSLWKGKDFSILLPRIFKDGSCTFQSDLDRALAILKKLKNALPEVDANYKIQKIAGTLTNCITSQSYSTIEELYYYMEQLFVRILCLYLVQVPKEIFKELYESPMEVCEEKLEWALKLLAKLDNLADQIQWLIPNELACSCVTDPVYFISKRQYCKVDEGIAHFEIARDGSEFAVVDNVAPTPLDDVMVQN